MPPMACLGPSLQFQCFPVVSSSFLNKFSYIRLIPDVLLKFIVAKTHTRVFVYHARQKFLVGQLSFIFKMHENAAMSPAPFLCFVTEESLLKDDF